MTIGLGRDLTRFLDTACSDACDLVQTIDAARLRAHSDDLVRSLDAAAERARELDQALGYARLQCISTAEATPLSSRQRYAWLVPAVAAAVLISVLCWAAWVYGYDPGWFAGSAGWLRLVLRPDQSWTLAAAMVLLAAVLGTYWWPRRRRQVAIGLIAVVTLVLVAAALGAASYVPCRGQVSTTGVTFWILQLFVGQRPDMLYQSVRAGAACTGAPPLALQLGQIYGLGATLMGAVAVSSVLWREPLNRLLSTFTLPRGHAGDHAPARGPRGLDSKAAHRLMAVAVWVVPVADRPRYGQEFGVELEEITLAGGGRFTQLAYATRLVLCAWHLRAELLSPHRRGAVQ